jgi:hypothetical protein
MTFTVLEFILTLLSGLLSKIGAIVGNRVFIEKGPKYWGIIVFIGYLFDPSVLY